MARRHARNDRLHRRYAVGGLEARLRFANPVTILDISAGGARIRTASHLRVGQDYPIRIDAGDRTVALRGRVVWCALAGSVRRGDHQVVPDYVAGVAFDRTFARLPDELLALADEGVLLELRKPLRGRAVLRSGESASPVVVREISVIRLGRSRMQLVADHAPALGSRILLRVALCGEPLETAGEVVAVGEFFGGGVLSEIDVELTELDAAQSSALARMIESELAAGGAHDA